MLLDLLFHHRQPGRNRFYRSEDTLLVFSSDGEKELFLEAQEAAKAAISRAARRRAIASQPIPDELDLQAVEQDAKRLLLDSIQPLIERQDYGRIVDIARVIRQMQEDDDIELLLLSA